MSFYHKISDHPRIAIPHGDLGGPLVADVAVFVVPSIRRRQAGDDIDLDTLEGIHVDVPDLLFRMEVSDSHVSELALAPLFARLNRHQMRELFQFHFFPVIPTDQVFPPQHEFPGFGVVNEDPLIVGEVVAEQFAQVPACVLVVVPGNPEEPHRGDFKAVDRGFAKARKALAKYLSESVVGAIDQGSLGRLLVGPVEVQKVIPYGNDDFLDRVGLDALQHRCNALPVILGGDFQVVVVAPGLFAPTELPEVAIVQAKLDKVFSCTSACLASLGLRHPFNEPEDTFLDRLGGLAFEFDADLSAGSFP